MASLLGLLCCLLLTGGAGCKWSPGPTPRDGSGADAMAPDGATADPARVDGQARADALRGDSGEPDATKPDAARPDAARPDAAKPDAAKPDAAPPPTVTPLIKIGSAAASPAPHATIKPGLSLGFSAVLTCPAGYTCVSSWDFGQGQTATGSAPPPVTYSSAGVFHVTLTSCSRSSEDTDRNGPVAAGR